MNSLALTPGQQGHRTPAAAGMDHTTKVACGMITVEKEEFYEAFDKMWNPAPQMPGDRSVSESALELL